MQESSVVLLSLHPKHAKKILSGEKNLEFRRVWATRPITAIVIYATTPVQKIVAIARVRHVHQGSPTALWELAKKIGGGLLRRELYGYFQGKKSGFAIELESVERFHSPLDAKAFIDGFRPPQSFSYIDAKIFRQLENELERQVPLGRVLFVAGVHGVGKTTLCENYAKERQIIHRSASQLIREAKESALANRGKAVKDIAGNQQLLISAVQQYRTSGSTLLLDGHFALLDAEHKPQPLPTNVFSELGIDGVVVIHDSPRQIAARIAKRDEHPLGINDLTTLQALELSRAEKVAQDLCIPSHLVKSGDKRSFDLVVGTLVGKTSRHIHNSNEPEN